MWFLGIRVRTGETLNHEPQTGTRFVVVLAFEASSLRPAPLVQLHDRCIVNHVAEIAAFHMTRTVLRQVDAGASAEGWMPKAARIARHHVAWNCHAEAWHKTRTSRTEPQKLRPQKRLAFISIAILPQHQTAQDP